MPRHGRLWWWSDAEMTVAERTLAATPEMVFPEYGLHSARPPAPGTFTSWHIRKAAQAITQAEGFEARSHGTGLRNALLMRGRIEVIDRSNPRRYLYRVKEHDGQQAQRPSSRAD